MAERQPSCERSASIVAVLWLRLEITSQSSRPPQSDWRENPKDERALRDYNFALARVFTTIRSARLDPWTQPLTVPGDHGGFVLTHRPDPRARWNPALYEFTPADQFDVHGSYVSERTIREGVGAPLVAIGRDVYREARAEFTLPRVYYGVTAVARFEGKRCIISFEDPLAVETVRLNGRTFPLAADFTVPVAVLLAKNNPKKFELTRLLRPDKYAETARIARLQPYDPNKAVVLVVHGLMDTPATWTPMINTLRGDEEIRRNYQFWFFSYPSGYPYPYSAAILRHELDAVHQKFHSRKPMVVIGHSMGGCISRLLITDTGDKLWMELFGKPPEQVNLKPETKKLFTEALIFSHRPEVGRVIFISAPLRGSDLAVHSIGRLGSSLVRLPVALLGAGRDAFKIMTFTAGDLRLRRLPNSVDTLAPTNRFVRAINTIPITRGIPYPFDHGRPWPWRHAEFQRRCGPVLELTPGRCAKRIDRPVRPQCASESAGHRGSTANSETQCTRTAADKGHSQSPSQ